METLESLTLSVFLGVVCIVGTAQAQQPALRFVPLTPCRIADTRNPAGPFGGPSIAGQSSRSFVIPNSACGVPSTAAAYSLNVTAIPDTGFLGYLTIWPTGGPPPLVSTLNSYDGRIKANAAIVPAGTGGAVSVYVTDTTDVLLDINGYFVLASNTKPTPLAFFALPPCRVADTRNSSDPLGGPSLVPWQERSFPILSSNCNIPSDGSAKAYSLNFTVVPQGFLGFLTIWPTGGPWPLVSTLNAPTGAVTANAAIVPAGVPNGAISALVTDPTDLVIDINGYFAPSSSSSDLSLYTLPPCRVVDTRLTIGYFIWGISEDMTASPCGIIPNAYAVVLNATAIPYQSLGFLTLWPDGQALPQVSTLNALDGQITSNMAIVPTGSSTSSSVIDAYATDHTQLVLDTSGYFASGTAPAPTMYVLSVASSGTGNGRGNVTSLDGKINCGAVCQVSYVSGTVVTLTASAASGSTFTGWSGDCSGTGNCTVTLSAAKNVTATFLGPHISLNSPPTGVGANLEQPAIFSLSTPAPTGGVSVTIKSPDPLLFTSNPTQPGQNPLTVSVPAGQGPPGTCLLACGFWIQALASSGTASITVSASSGYLPAQNIPVQLTPSGFQLSGPMGTGMPFTATLGAPSPTPLTVSVAQLDASGNVLSTNQTLRGGFTASVPVNSSMTTIGTIVPSGSQAVFNGGDQSNTSLSFQPLALGNSLLSISQPQGFSRPAAGGQPLDQLTATVALPTITLSPVTVGYNLVAPGGVAYLSQPPSSTLSVTISASPAGQVLLSASPTACPCTNPLTLQVAAGQTALPFYVQGLVPSGGATLTASAQNYSNSNTANVTVTPSAFLLASGNGNNPSFGTFSTTTLSPPTPLTVVVWQLNSSLQRPAGSGPGLLRPGISQLAVAVVPISGSGTVIGSPAYFNGGDQSNTTLLFQPCSTPCSTVLQVQQPSGFAASPPDGQLTATVTQSTVTLRLAAYPQTTTIGSNLEVPGTVSLDAPAPNCTNGGLTLTISSGDTTKVLLSTSPTASGSPSIQVVVSAGQFSTPPAAYYVQALANTVFPAQALLTVSFPSGGCGFSPGPGTTVNLAPAGFVISGVNGVGQEVSARVGDNVPLTVSPAVLDATTLAPIEVCNDAAICAVSGGLSVSVNVTSSPAGVVSGTPVTVGFSGGIASLPVTVTAVSSGQTATLTAATPSKPSGFSTPSPGNQLNVVIQ
jgi:hypothetical protein